MIKFINTWINGKGYSPYFEIKNSVRRKMKIDKFLSFFTKDFFGNILIKRFIQLLLLLIWPLFKRFIQNTLALFNQKQQMKFN